MFKIFCFILFLSFINLVYNNVCEEQSNNKEPLIKTVPILNKKITNGQKLIIGDINDPQRNFLYIARLKGTPYEMGKAFGELFETQLKDQINIFYDYYKNQAIDFLVKVKIPRFMATSITNSAETLLKHILDFNCQITKKYTNPRYYQEIKGIAAGAKIKSKEISRLNIFPELIKAACTVAGVWGPASASKHTLHLRALDWDSNMPISKYPLITIYQSSNSSHQKHANIGWVGLIGVLTGISQKVSIGQKVWMPPSGSVQTTRYGNPWTYVLRDLLYEAKNITSALRILSQTHRTCSIHLGLASVEDHSFRMLEYSYKILNNYNDTNYTHYDNQYHPKKVGIAYFDKFVQPSKNACVGTLLVDQRIYGRWELESLWRIIGQRHHTGDTQLVVFNLQTMEGMVSYSQYNSTRKAFSRSPIHVNFKPLFEDFE